MATETESYQYALTTCSEHPNEELFSYCSTCHHRICEKCLKGNHKDHEWTLNRNHARKVRQNGHQISERIRKEIIPSAQSSTRKERKEEQRKKVLDTQRRMTDLISRYTQHLLYVIDRQASDDEGEDRFIEKLLKLADFFEKHVQIASDNVVIEMEEEYHGFIKQHTQSTTQASNEIVFKEGDYDEDVIKQMFGNVIVNKAKLKVTNMNTLMFGTDNIVSVVATSTDRLWIRSNKSTKCTLVNDKGNLVNQMDFGRMYNHFVVKNNTHLYSEPSSKAIMKNTDGKSESICSVHPLFPAGICESRDGGMLVCLVESPPAHISEDGKGEVQHIDMSGKIIMKYTTDNRDKKNLFIHPFRVAQNINSDICVVDVMSKYLAGRVVAVTVDSKIRFVYKGNPNLGKKFLAGDIICDSEGRIILSDFNNNAIHMISIDGYFLQFLLTKDDGLLGPYSITLHKNRLSVGCKRGVIKQVFIEEES